MEQVKLCENCPKRDKCRKPCPAVEKILWKDNRIMERHYKDRIEFFSQGKEVCFSDLADYKPDQFTYQDTEGFLKTDELRLRKTAVFVERFFKKTPCKDLAEKYGVKENTIVTMYKQAVEQVEKLVKLMDARKNGIKAVMPDKFTEAQKWFLLVHVFGFSNADVARIFNYDRNVVGQRIKRMTDTYQTLFTGHEFKEKIPIEDPPLHDKLTREDIVQMVEAYADQGLSHQQAFLRIAGRYGEHVGRTVSYKGIGSRYYKAMKTAAA